MADDTSRNHASEMNESEGEKALSGRPKLPGSIFALGFVSLLSDVSSEMVYPLLPFFLSSVLGAGTVAIGLKIGRASCRERV